MIYGGLCYLQTFRNLYMTIVQWNDGGAGGEKAWADHWPHPHLGTGATCKKPEEVSLTFLIVGLEECYSWFKLHWYYHINYRDY